MQRFKANLELIGVNPYLQVPERILQAIFKASGKEKGAIPVHGTINGKAYKQTLVRYLGAWRLYVNTGMLKHSPKRIGEELTMTIAYDPAPRSIEPPESFVRALERNAEARSAFEKLAPSRQLEITRYLARLKSAEALEKNIVRAISFLLGKSDFVGRKKTD